jgi:hypothetical protein
MSKNLKFIYEFTIDKEIEKTVEEKKMEGDQEVKITRTEKVKEPVKFAILKPGRKLYDSAEIFLAKTVSTYIKEGLMPISLVAKRFGNDGGVLTEKESEYMGKLDSKMIDCQKRLSELKIDKDGLKEGTSTASDTAKQSDILVEMLGVQTEIDKIKNSFFALYDNTAEMKGRKKSIEWWITHLSLVQNEKQEYINYFSELSFDDKYIKYAEILDGDDNFLKDTVNKFTYLISSWINSDQNLTPDQFKALDENFEESIKESVR